ncbi:MAG: paraquat-inducible protein A [Candidatus Omnitrophota bacterium]
MSDPKKSLREIYPKRYEIPFLLVLSGGLLVFGLTLPVLTLKEMLVMKSTFSVLTGIANLWKDKQPVLAGIIVLFSVIFPITKLSVLLCIWGIRLTEKQRKTIMHWIEMLGKWSMLDVFVVAVTVVAVKFGFMIHAEPRVGVYVFASSILVAMGTAGWMGRLIEKTEK